VLLSSISLRGHWLPFTLSKLWFLRIVSSGLAMPSDWEKHAVLAFLTLQSSGYSVYWIRNNVLFLVSDGLGANLLHRDGKNLGGKHGNFKKS
jgi:hypothetical protein